MIRILIDPIACDAYGYCAELLPEAISLDEWGYPIVDGKPLPTELVDAAEACRPGLPTSRRSRCESARVVTERACGHNNGRVPGDRRPHNPITADLVIRARLPRPTSVASSSC